MKKYIGGVCCRFWRVIERQPFSLFYGQFFGFFV